MITLVPQLRPVIDGVGDYAFHLAQTLEKIFGIEPNFIVGNPTWRSENAGKVYAHSVKQRSADALLEQLSCFPNGSIVFLHYVPHGYARKACPFWLIQGLEKWRQQNPKSYLLTMFHELYACDWHRPWSTDLWFSPVQRYLAARLAQLSDVCFTSNQHYSERVTYLSAGKHNQPPAIPVFSNVGEPETVLPLSQRKRQLVIFGQRHSKDLIYRKSLSQLEQVCRQLEIETIVDIGPASSLTPAAINNTPVNQLGKLPIPAIGQQLSQALAGFLTYNPDRLGKSGIFAAYCAHGMLPINHRSAKCPVDQLVAGIHYWVPSQRNPPGDVQEIADQAYIWYQTHTIARQAKLIMECLPDL
jgi:hypothetical protein